MGRIPKVQSLKTMMLAPQIRGGLVAVIGILLLSGCASTYAKRQVTYSEIALAQPKSEIAEPQLLGVRIKPFEPGEIPKEEEESRGLSEEIRKAEGYYSAVQLRNSMQQSGYWGPVRVVPAAVTGGEVIITGRIIESDGEILKLEVSVQDATGSVWFTRQYEEVVDTEVYHQAKNGGEAFQYLYNRIANDVAEYRESLEPKKVESVRQVAELKFAEDFAPTAFQGYLVREEPKQDNNPFVSKNSDGQEQSSIVKLARLPAEDDSMLQRIRRIRVREEALVDTLDLQYEKLSREMGDEYTQWRSARLNEMNAVRELDKKRNEKVGKAVAYGAVGVIAGAAIIAATGGKYGGGTVGGVIAGAGVGIGIQMAMQASQEAEEDRKIHKAALEELGDSLAEDLKVTVVQVEGETFELKGNAEAKFKQWREILKQIHEREVGTLEPPKAIEVRSPDPAEVQSADPADEESGDPSDAQPAYPIPVLPRDSETEVEQT